MNTIKTVYIYRNILYFDWQWHFTVYKVYGGYLLIAQWGVPCFFVVQNWYMTSKQKEPSGYQDCDVPLFKKSQHSCIRWWSFAVIPLNSTLARSESTASVDRYSFMETDTASSGWFWNKNYQNGNHWTQPNTGYTELSREVAPPPKNHLCNNIYI